MRWDGVELEAHQVREKGEINKKPCHSLLIIVTLLFVLTPTPAPPGGTPHSRHQDLFAPMVVDAVSGLKNDLSDLNLIGVKKVPGGEVRQVRNTN